MPTAPVLSENELLALVQRGISEGRLPVLLPSVISASYGTGAEFCRVCALIISAADPAYEITQPCPTTLIFHFRCYVVWQRECAEQLANCSTSEGECTSLSLGAQSVLQALGHVLEHAHETCGAVERDGRELASARGRTLRLRH